MFICFTLGIKIDVGCRTCNLSRFIFTMKKTYLCKETSVSDSGLPQKIITIFGSCF